MYLCKCVLFNTPKNRPGKQQTCRYWQRWCPEMPLTHTNRADQSWNVTLTSWVQQEGGKYSWHTNRKWLEPPHNEVSCISPPPTHDSSLTYSPLSLISQNPSSHPALSGGPRPSDSLYLPSCSSLHILISSLLTHPILTFRLSQKLKWKQEVINQWSVPLKRKTNYRAAPCFS